MSLIEILLTRDFSAAASAASRLAAKPLHVLMLSDVYAPRINGVSTSMQTFRAELLARGVRVTVVAPDYPGMSGGDDADVIRLPSRGVPLDPEDRLMHWGALTNLDRRLASADYSAIDVVHVQTPFAAHYAGLCLARARGIPCIATFHTHFEEYLSHYIRFLPRGVLRATARKLARQQCNALDAVVVPSKPMATTLTDYGVTVPLHVIPTGLPESQFVRGNGRRFREAWGIAPERRIALFVGRAAFEKNIGFLLEMADRASRQLPQLMLVIAGEGPALPALRRQAEALHLEDHVRFVGYLPRDSGLRDCYAAADVFTFASLTETQGLVLLEAMAIGLPVLAIPALGAAEIIAPRRGAIPAAATPEAFAAQLVALLRQPATLDILANEAVSFAREWDAATQGARLASLYRDLRRAPLAATSAMPLAASR
jgi:hypothetical protein